jgi:hypothetical protein
MELGLTCIGPVFPHLFSLFKLFHAVWWTFVTEASLLADEGNYCARSTKRRGRKICNHLVDKIL